VKIDAHNFELSW